MRDDTAAKKAVSDAARVAEQGFAEEFARQRAIRNREKSVVRRRTEAVDNEAKRRRAMCESGQRTLDGTNEAADPGCCTAQNFDQDSEKWRRSEGRDSPDPLAVQKSVGGQAKVGGRGLVPAYYELAATDLRPPHVLSRCFVYVQIHYYILDFIIIMNKYEL